MPRFVLTGAPGTGKTTLTNLLSPRYTTIAEPARALIAEHYASTGESSLDGRPQLFVDRLVERSIDLFKSSPEIGTVFFDRGLPDCVAYASVMGLDTEEILGKAAEFRYDNPVFFAPPWKDIYITDEMRRATFDQVEEFDRHIRSAYAQLGYELIELPKTLPEQRIETILGYIEEHVS